ncbi:SDR family NAD(P)-dependent oxidoreductase [Microbacterium gorillae]|uniref:SDR family NAD(P)-dependent oxidoreductase n=1 Tax=Microbacterium gorillae TaxID=1231063 RepID=UPI00058DA200|nr:SDR family oxidoreductase [Microbacterium gorillae]
MSAAIVTGGSRGVGRAIVERLAGQGYDVVFSYRREVAAAEELARSLSSSSGRSVTAVAADLAVEGEARRLGERALERVGTPDVVVGNAGQASRGQSVTDSARGEYERLFAVSVLSNVELAATVLPAMRAAGSGSFVFVGSTVSDTQPAGSGPYAVSKTALDAVARVLALEERVHGIRVNVVAPGLVATDMGDRLVRASAGSRQAADLDARYPFGRVCRPEDIADAVVALADATMSYVTGQRLIVDGGGPAAAIVP